MPAPPSRPAIVLLHGYPLHGAMWTAQRDALAAAGFRVLVPDLRGHGASPPRATATMDDMATDVLATLDAQGIDRFAVAGFSMGGYVALVMTAMAPGRIAGLALVDSRTAADNPAQQAARAGAIDAARTGMATVADAMLPKLLSASANEALVAGVRAMILSNPVEGAVAAIAGMRDRADRADAFAALQAPRVMIVGEDDVITPLQEARATAPPGVDIVVVPGGHLAPMESPDAVSTALVAWASRL